MLKMRGGKKLKIGLFLSLILRNILLFEVHKESLKYKPRNDILHHKLLKGKFEGKTNIDFLSPR